MNKLILAVVLAVGCATVPTRPSPDEGSGGPMPHINYLIEGAGAISTSSPTSGVPITGTSGTFTLGVTVGGNVSAAAYALGGTSPSVNCIGASSSDQFCVSPNTATWTASAGAHVASSTSLLLDRAAGTAGSGTGITAQLVGTAAVSHWVDKVVVDRTALTAASTTDVTIWTTPVNTRLLRVTGDVTQVFTGGALSAMTVMCGNVAGGNQYLLSGSVLAATTTLGDVQAEIGAGLLSATVADMGTPATGVPGAIAISCRFTCTGANCSAATQGSVTFQIEGVTYP